MEHKRSWVSSVYSSMLSIAMLSAAIPIVLSGYVSGDDSLIVETATLRNGISVRCFDDESIPIRIYRYEEVSESLRLYPNSAIAASWSKSWEDYIGLYCKKYKQGPKMGFNMAILSDGQSIKCSEDEETHPDAIYRVVKPPGLVRRYPNDEVGLAWNRNYKQYRNIDCTGLHKGEPMQPRSHIQNHSTDVSSGNLEELLPSGTDEEVYDTSETEEMILSTQLQTLIPTPPPSSEPSKLNLRGTNSIQSGVDSSTLLTSSWVIEQQPTASIIRDESGHGVLEVPYRVSERFFSVYVFENDCSTPSTALSMNYRTIKSEGDLIDVVVDLSVTNHEGTITSISRRNVSICLSFTLYVDATKSTVMSKKDIFFTANTHRTGIESFYSFSKINIRK